MCLHIVVVYTFARKVKDPEFDFERRHKSLLGLHQGKHPE